MINNSSDCSNNDALIEEFQEESKREEAANKVNEEEDDSTLYDIIGNNLRLAFWDEIEEELKAKRYNRFLFVLVEFVEKLCGLVPHREDIHREVNDSIDVALIGQMLRHDAVDYAFIFGVIQYIIDTLKRFDSIEDEPFYEAWREQINIFMARPDIRNEIILPIFMREAFLRLGTH